MNLFSVRHIQPDTGKLSFLILISIKNPPYTNNVFGQGGKYAKKYDRQDKPSATKRRENEKSLVPLWYVYIIKHFSTNFNEQTVKNQYCLCFSFVQDVQKYENMVFNGKLNGLINHTSKILEKLYCMVYNNLMPT